MKSPVCRLAMTADRDFGELPRNKQEQQKMGRTIRKCHSRVDAQACLMLMAVWTCLLCSGCGGSGTVDLNAPAEPGSAAELAGTRWTNPDTKVIYYFEDETNLQVINPDQADPVLTVYSVDNGIVDLSIGMTSQNGTWDGKNLILEGTTLNRE
ncbi:MAG: hypothetical protein IT364_22795 [Candidatus Hydrogenedentes bacterium]|nr:hypothetical protein [Candidatus Hydrogenedentota bacterium]